MSHTAEPSRKVIPAQLGFLAIYNPSLGTTEETLENQILYYSSPADQDQNRERDPRGPTASQDAFREKKNEQWRQIGLAQGIVEFSRTFADGQFVDTIETEKSRIILHELEPEWWILASINLTILPGTNKTPAKNDRAAEEKEATEYSSREVKPAALLLRDLLQAHSTFLLHNGPSMDTLFSRTRRSKFIGLLAHYWDMFILTWNVLLHGNPANRLYRAIKIAACGELGIGVGEEDRGSAEREVLEGFVGRIDGLVDVVVSKFRDTGLSTEEGAGGGKRIQANLAGPWLGSGNEPDEEDGVIFLGTGTLSRKSLRDISHWMEDLYRWGRHAYGAADNLGSNRRAKKSKPKPSAGMYGLPPELKKKPGEANSVTPLAEASQTQSLPKLNSMTVCAPMPIDQDEDPHDKQKLKEPGPSPDNGQSSKLSVESESSNSSIFVNYMKLGFGTYWSLGGLPGKEEGRRDMQDVGTLPQDEGEPSSRAAISGLADNELVSATTTYSYDESVGYYLIGLMGNIEDDYDDPAGVHPEDSIQPSKQSDGHNARLISRTVTVELEGKPDDPAKPDINTLLGDRNGQRPLTPPKLKQMEESTPPLGNQNKTKELRVVVYVNKPFIFVFLFELTTPSTALATLLRSLHYQIQPLLKPLILSTKFRAPRLDLRTADRNDAKNPVYYLIWDPKLLTVRSTIPNIPDPSQMRSESQESIVWSRIEALNTHMQIVNTYVAASTAKAELERTCKTSRGWWVVWTRIPEIEPPPAPLRFGPGNTLGLIEEYTSEPQASMGSGTSPGTNETPASTYGFAKEGKEIFLLRRASDFVAAKSARRFVSGSSTAGDSSWSAGPGKLTQGIGVDTKRYIEALLNLDR